MDAPLLLVFAQPSKGQFQNQPRQEPGKYLVGVGVVAVGPQTHLKISAPTSELVNATVADLNGTSCTLVLAASFRSVAEVVVTVIDPASVVTIERTYFVGALVLAPVVFFSQPQRLATGSAVLAVD